jgi:thiamine pyrophosphokinase
MKFIIFANGTLKESTIKLDSHARILAADGGAQHCLQLGIIPEAVIGDFDSLSAQEIRQLESRGAVLHRYPADKDETDLELALDYALAAGADEIILYGLLGGRWDMSFANILLLAAPRYTGVHFQVIAEGTRMYILRGGESLDLTGETGETVSVLPLSPEIHGLVYQGLAWPLENASLLFGSPRGVSNRLVGHAARISLVDGVVLVVHTPGLGSESVENRTR